MYPSMVERNFTPSSTADASPPSMTAGVVEDGQSVQGQPDGSAAVVVNDHVKLDAIALPAASLTRGSVPPPFTVAVYVDVAAKAEVGVNVAVRVAGS
jgi:hypothetical protein